MIAAALLLVAVGVSDAARLVPGRRGSAVAVAVSAILLFVASAAVDAAGWGLLAIALAAVWTVAMPRDGSGRAGLWPVAVLAASVVVGVAAQGARADVRVFGAVLRLPGPDGPAPIDLAILVAGCGLFLCASANIVVRSALRGETHAVEAASGLKGGRLIGPLERLLVFALTTAGAFTLLAAVLAAKGIVRFPEISRDSGEGDRAEYFLVGTLVSWSLGVAAAFLVAWAAAPR